MNNDRSLVRALLVRHGETAENAAGLVQGQGRGSLSELGRRQALAVADRLRAEDFAAIYTSDLARARETAEIIASALAGLPVVGDERLREQGFGVYEGGSVRQLLRTMVKAGADFTSFDPEGGERAGAFRARVAGFFAALAARHPGETVLLVTHHGFIRMTRQLFLAWQRPPEPLGAVGNGSITVVKLDRAEILSLGESVSNQGAGDRP